MASYEWQIENERLLDKVRTTHGVTVNTYAGWKAMGKFVRKGQKQRAFQVESGVNTVIDPITGETQCYPKMVWCYGFLANQTY